MKKPQNRQRHSRVDAANSAPRASRMDWLLEPSVQIGLLLFVGLGLYLHTMNAPFLFDDFGCVKDNPAIRNLSYFFDFDKVRALNLPPDLKNNFALRPVAYLTFYVNYTLGGVAEFGYHLVNTAIHLLTALLVYLLAAVTLKRAPLGEADGSFTLNRLLPLLVALLFVVHPLQTQAVTYVTQRFTSLVTLLYLLALLLYIGARTAKTSRSRWSCYGSSLVVTILAMRTKEIAFTLPAIMLLYDFFFLDGMFKERCRSILPFLLTMAIIPATLIWLTQTNNTGLAQEGLSQSLNLVNFSQVGRWDYLVTQFAVITTYLRMLFLPIGQNLDHDYRLARTFFEWNIIESFFLLFFLFAGALLLAIRSFEEKKRGGEKIISFGILWFFLTLSVESSIIPIDDLLVEHRLYLPSFGIFLASVVAASLAVGRGLLPKWAFFSAAGSVVMILGVLTVARNDLYRDDVRMLEDVVAKSPDKPRARSLLGTAYFDRGRFDEAIAALRKVVELQTNNVNALGNLGCAYLAKEQYDDAIRYFQRAIDLASNNYHAHASLGVCYFYKGRVDEAEQEYRQSLTINPHFSDARKNLADLYALQGRNFEAIAQYRTLLASDPKNQEAAGRLRILTGQ